MLFDPIIRILQLSPSVIVPSIPIIYGVSTVTLQVIKALDVKIYANGRCLHQRVVNKKVNMKAYSSKTITVTV